MATISTPQFGSSTCPQAQLIVTESSSTATTSVLSWTLKWVTHGYTVSSSLNKDYTVKINGSTVKTGSFAINGKTTQTIASGTTTITKGTAAKSIPLALSFVMNFTWKNVYGGTKTASGSISVAAKTSYKVAYNANGGSGAPGQQTKTYGVTLKLSTTKPTRTNYNFKGWSKTSSGAVAYTAGANYTSNAAITLYAVWELAYTKPTITNVKAVRCNQNGDALETGTYCKISFNWSCSQLTGANPVKTITIAWGSDIVTVTASGNSGSSSQVVGGSLGVDNSYTFTIKVTDTKDGVTTVTKVLGTTKFPIDFKSGGTGVAFGKTAETDNLAEFGYQAQFTGGIKQVVIPSGTDLNDLRTPNIYTGDNANSANYANIPFTSGTFTLVVESAGPNGQVKQTITVCDKNKARSWERYYYASEWGAWRCIYDFQGAILWSGGCYMNSSHTITLAEKVSAQKNGILLVFSEYYDGEAKNASFVSHFVSKRTVATHSGCGHIFQMCNSNLAYFATKYLYIHDTKITGHNNNTLTGTAASGIKYTNNRFVLRYVIGV